MKEHSNNLSMTSKKKSSLTLWDEDGSDVAVSAERKDITASLYSAYIYPASNTAPADMDDGWWWWRRRCRWWWIGADDDCDNGDDGYCILFYFFILGCVALWCWVSKPYSNSHKSPLIQPTVAPTGVPPHLPEWPHLSSLCPHHYTRMHSHMYMYK